MNSQTTAPKSSSRPSSGRTSGQQTPRGGGTTSNPAPPAPAPFTPTPQYAPPTPWKPSSIDDFADLAGIPESQRDTFLASGLNPRTWNGLAPAAQQTAAQWGANLPYAPGIVDQQKQQYQTDQLATQFRNNQVDTFGNFQNSQLSSLQDQYNQGLGMATGRADWNEGVLREGLDTDLGLLGEGKYRNVDLARAGMGIDQNYLNTMRSVATNQQGIRHTEHGNEQDYINAMIGQLNNRRGLAFEKYGVNDRYAAQQAQDNATQYGFNARGYQQDLDQAFSQRGTQQRGNRSDAAARGAFGSAGFRDNEQDIMDQYGQSLSAANLGLDSANQQVDERDRAIGNSRQNLGLDYRGQEIAFGEQQLGYDRSHQNNNTGYQMSQEQYRGQMAGYDKQGRELQQTGKALDSLAREYGIKETDLRNGFKNGLTKIGLDLADTQTQLEQMLSSGNAQLIQQGMNFMAQIMAQQ